MKDEPGGSNTRSLLVPVVISGDISQRSLYARLDWEDLSVYVDQNDQDEVKPADKKKLKYQ